MSWTGGMSRQTDFETTSPLTTAARRAISPVPGARNMPQVLSASAGPQVQIEAQMELRGFIPGARTMSPPLPTTGPMSPVYGATSQQRGSSSTPPMRFDTAGRFGSPDPQFSSPRQDISPYLSNILYEPGQVFPHPLRAMHSSHHGLRRTLPANSPQLLLYENPRTPHHNHPGGNPGANLKSISNRCHPILVEFVWELT